MRRISSLLFLAMVFILVGIFGSTTKAKAEEPNSDGYISRDGYYWYGANAYTRIQVYKPSYYYNGYCYPASYAWSYTFHHAYAPPAITYKDANWRSKVLDLVIEKNKLEANLRKDQAEQEAYQKTITTLGIGSSFNLQNYVQGTTPYTQNHSLQLSVAGVNASTVYGYSNNPTTYNALSTFYGETNVNSLFQQLNRLAENQQKLSGQAVSDFSTLVGAAGQNQAEVAKIVAKTNAVGSLLANLEQNKSVVSQSVSVKVGSDQQPSQTMPYADSSGQWATIAKNECFSCHGNGKKEGSFDVTSYPTMTQDQKMIVIQRLISQDPQKHMPRKSDGTAGRQLNKEEIKAWLDN